MCKFTTKARLHFFSSYNQIIPPDEMKTERKNSIKKKGERQKKRILNRRETSNRHQNEGELGKDIE